VLRAVFRWTRTLCHECNNKQKLNASNSSICVKCSWVVHRRLVHAIIHKAAYQGYRYMMTFSNTKTQFTIPFTSIVKCASWYFSETMHWRNGLKKQFIFSKSTELTSTGRELKGDVYCMNCYFQIDLAICAACHRPIDSEITVNALGKQWHIEAWAIV
jgi:hypothetical protein